MTVALREWHPHRKGLRCWRVAGLRRKRAGRYWIVISALDGEEAVARAEQLMGPPTYVAYLHDEAAHDGGPQPRVGDGS
jgi:hypothetical protein